MSLPITHALSSSAALFSADPASKSENAPALCQGNIGSRESKALYALLTTEFSYNEGTYTLQSLFQALDAAKCLGAGSVTLVGSAVFKTLGSAFFQGYAKTDVGSAFEVTPHDIDFRIALPQTTDYQGREDLKKKIEMTLKQHFGSDLVLEPFQNIEDPAGKNHFIIAGIEGSLRVELLWVAELGRRSLFNEDGLHLEIPRAFWMHESGYVKWNSGEMPLVSLVENWVKNTLSVNRPETVDKRGWGRLMVKLALGKTLLDPSLIETFLLKALLTLQGNKGVGLARLLTHATRNLPEEDRVKVFDKALQTLQVHLGNPNLIGYTKEDLKTFVESYFPDTLDQKVWLYLLCKDKSIIHACAELKKNEGLKAIIKERAPELIPLLEAKEGASQLAALVEFCAFEAAWKYFQTNASRVPLSKFLLGIIRASLKYPQHLTEGVKFIAQAPCPPDEKKEAIRFLFLNLPMTPFPAPRSLLIEGEAALTDPELISLYDSWIYPILIQEVAKSSSFEEARLHLHLVGPEGERFVPAALKTFKEEVPLEDPLSYAKKHEATLYSVQFLIYFKQLKSANTAVFYLSAFIRHYEALRKDRTLLEQAQKRLLDLAPYLSYEELLDKLSVFEDEKILVLAQEANRFRLIPAAEKEVERILDKPPALETSPKKILQLLDLFCAGYPLTIAIWLRWLTALNQKHFEGKSGRILASLTQVPQGSAEQMEKFWIAVLQSAQRVSENPLSRTIAPAAIVTSFPVQTSSRYIPFINALEGFLLAHVKRDSDVACYHPCFTVLHSQGRLNNSKWIPLVPHIPLNHFIVWSASFALPELILASLKELTVRRGDNESIFNLFNRLDEKSKKEGALIFANGDLALFTQAILRGYLEPFLADITFFPFIEQAAKTEFWALYQYPGLKTFFENPNLLACKERGFYELIVGNLLEVFPELRSAKVADNSLLVSKLIGFLEQLAPLSDDFKHRILLWSLELNLLSLINGTVFMKVLIITRFAYVGDMRPCKESHFGRGCEVIVDMINLYCVPSNIENFLLPLVIHASGLKYLNNSPYTVIAGRDKEMIEATNYIADDPVPFSAESEGSESLVLSLKNIPPEKREGLITRWLYVVQYLIDRLDAKHLMLYSYLDFIACQLWLAALQIGYLSLSNKIQLVKCFESFFTWPLPHVKFYDVHIPRCQKILRLMEKRTLYDISRLRAHQKEEINFILQRKAFAVVYLGLSCGKLQEKQPCFQNSWIKVIKDCKRFMEKRDQEGIEDKSVIFSRMLFALTTAPVMGLSPDHHAFRIEFLESLKAFIMRHPYVVFNEKFRCIDLFNALIPADNKAGEDYNWETCFLADFPHFLTKHLEAHQEPSEASLYLKDQAYLFYIVYFFLVSRDHLLPEDKSSWFVGAVELLVSTFKNVLAKKEVYPTRFSRLIVLAAQLIFPFDKAYERVKAYVGGRRVYLAKGLITTIATSPVSEKDKREYLALFLGSLSASGYPQFFSLLDLMDPEEARLANYTRGSKGFEASFDIRQLEWLKG